MSEKCQKSASCRKVGSNKFSKQMLEKMLEISKLASIIMHFPVGPDWQKFPIFRLNFNLYN
jgi:hypothetical protein